MDFTTDIASLKQKLIQFRDERDWKQFHTPKNLAMGLAIETSELQELFLWKTEEEIRAFLDTENGNQKVEEELADIFIYLLYLVDTCGIDLAKATGRKIQINGEKYPVEKSHGNSTKYNELDPK